MPPCTFTPEPPTSQNLASVGLRSTHHPKPSSSHAKRAVTIPQPSSKSNSTLCGTTKPPGALGAWAVNLMTKQPTSLATQPADQSIEASTPASPARRKSHERVSSEAVAKEASTSRLREEESRRERERDTKASEDPW